MSYVPFTTTGTLKPYFPGLTSFSGSYRIVQPETEVVVSSGAITGSTPYSLTDIHTTLDRYYVLIGGYGYIGEAGLVSGLSPTVPVYVRDYQFDSLNEPSITHINSRDFEDNTLSGLTLSFVNSSGIVTSGLVNSGALEGNYYLGLSATSLAACKVEPDDTTTTGMLCGRAIWLSRMATTTTTGNSATAFAFLRQGPLDTSECYKVVAETNSASDRYHLMLRVGQMTSSGNITANGDSAVTTLSQRILDFTSNAVRDANRALMVGVEWEVTAKGTLFRLYSKVYNDSDTVDTFKDQAYLLAEHFYCGLTESANLYNTTSEKPAWWLASANTSLGDMGIDLLHLESLTSLSGGMADFEVLERNTATGSTDVRPFLSRRLGNTTGATPEGAPVLALTNPLIRAQDSIFNRAGAAFAGIELTHQGGSSSDFVFTSLVPKDASTAGITKGVLRVGLLISGQTASGRSGPKFGFSFLRQGSSVNSNCYTIELRMVNADQYRVRLLKGTVVTGTFDDTVDFNGTLLVESAIITTVATGTGYCWLEIRWEVEAPSSVKVEALFGPMTSGLSSFDSSPGNVDYKLVQVLTHNDTTSPYSTTSEKPMITLRNMNPGSGSPTLSLLTAELRRPR